MSPVPDSQTWGTETLNISLEGLKKEGIDGYPLSSALDSSGDSKMIIYSCKIIMIAAWWSGMSCFGLPYGEPVVSVLLNNWADYTAL